MMLFKRVATLRRKVSALCCTPIAAAKAALMKLSGLKKSSNAIAGASIWNQPRHRVKARMPVDRYAEEYNMNHPERGLAVIFNHEFYENVERDKGSDRNLERREGTNVDCNNLMTSLKNLYFDVREHKDLTWEEMLEKIEKLAEMDHSNKDCICITIMTHGGAGGFLYAKDYPYELSSILSCFTADRCPTLAGKPKIFFIQACQGEMKDAGITLIAMDSTYVDSYSLPIYADFVVVNSTCSGFVSYRDTKNGTWFIQSLCQVLNQYGKNKDLGSLMTLVNQSVACNFETCAPGDPMMHNKKQIPCVTSMLTRLVHFTEK